MDSERQPLVKSISVRTLTEQRVVVESWWARVRRRQQTHLPREAKVFVNHRVWLWWLLFPTCLCGVLWPAMGLAYYNHEPRPLGTVVDLGFRLIPELADPHAPDAPMWSVMVKFYHEFMPPFAGLITFLVAMSDMLQMTPDRWYRKANRPRFFSLAQKRVLQAMIVCYLIRVSLFLTTTLPGPTPHCRPGANGYNPPSSVWEAVFGRLGSISSNCGDLVMSGHLIMVIAPMLALSTFYAPLHYLTVWMLPMEIYAIIATRSHYTIDVVSSLIIVPLVWHWLTTHEPPVVLDMSAYKIDPDGADSVLAPSEQRYLRAKLDKRRRKQPSEADFAQLV